MEFLFPLTFAGPIWFLLGSERDVGELQSDSSHYCGFWLSHRAAVHKVAYSHPVCRIPAPTSHSETFRTNERYLVLSVPIQRSQAVAVEN